MSRTAKWLLVTSVTFVLGIGILLRPICVPLPPDFPTAGLDQRSDRDFYLCVFQKRDGVWCQCKTYLSRQLFF